MHACIEQTKTEDDVCNAYFHSLAYKHVISSLAHTTNTHAHTQTIVKCVTPTYTTYALLRDPSKSHTKSVITMHENPRQIPYPRGTNTCSICSCCNNTQPRFLYGFIRNVRVSKLIPPESIQAFALCCKRVNQWSFHPNRSW